MKVALLYSGGKDSTYALDYAREKGWDVRYLISVKPTRKDCFLYHFATVENTPQVAEMLGIKQVLLACDVADPVEEAKIVQEKVTDLQKFDPVDAIVLGGTGLQETQIKSIHDAMKPLSIEVFAAHSGLDHDKVMEEMTNKGYEFIITQVASEGLMQWLGKKITKANLPELIADSRKFGFHHGGEGGYYDSFIVAGPIFGDKEIVVEESEKVVDDKFCGHIVIKSFKFLAKPSIIPSTGIAAFE
jgi:diphthine-ammonia ligase